MASTAALVQRDVHVSAAVKLRALIVDDDADARQVVAGLLRDALPAVQVVDVPDALALTTLLGDADIGLAIVARELAWADGLDLLRLLHRQHPGCATILLGTPPADQDDPDAQPDAHLSRSIAGLARLSAAVPRVLGKRQQAGRAAAGPAGDLPIALLELDADERVLSANARAVSLFGHDTARALAGRRLVELVNTGAPDGPGPGQQTVAAFAASKPDGLAARLHPACGEPVPCRLLARAHASHGLITGFTAALMPGVTASDARSDNLLYAVSHDLKQPLATTTRSAQMLAERLQSQGRLDGDEGRMLRRILSGTARMDSLMSGLLDYVRTGHNPVARERVDLAAVCAEVVRGLQTPIEETGGVVRWDDLPAIEASRAEVARLLENLIGNALKFRGPDSPVVVVDCVERDDDWVLSVRDNGIGIDETESQRIFEPFQRLHTESEFPGTGIGLAACRQICERHGGHIWVTSNTEGGSTFFASLSKDGRAGRPGSTSGTRGA